MVSCEQTVFLCYNAVISQYSVNEFYLHVWVSTNWQEKSFPWNLRTRLRFSLLFTIAVSLGERVSRKCADLYAMCHELDALLTGSITGTQSVYCIPTCTCSTAGWMSENSKIPNSKWTKQLLVLKMKEI